METRGTIEIDAPIDKVFRLTTEHVPEWSSVVAEEHVLTTNEDGSRATFRMVTETQRAQFAGTVKTHEPPHASVVVMEGDQVDMHVAYMFEDLGGSTRVTQVSNVTAKSTGLKFVFFLGGGAIKSVNCKAVEKELGLLKAFCENQRP